MCNDIKHLLKLDRTQARPGLGKAGRQVTACTSSGDYAALRLHTDSPVIGLLETALIGAVTDRKDKPDRSKDKERQDNDGGNHKEVKLLIGGE
jgi:hypothetical protein